MQKSVSKIPNLQCLQAAAAPYPRGLHFWASSLGGKWIPVAQYAEPRKGLGWAGERAQQAGILFLQQQLQEGRKRARSGHIQFPSQQTLPFYPISSRRIFVHLDYSKHFLLTDFTTSSLASSNLSITATILIFLKLRVSEYIPA